MQIEIQALLKQIQAVAIEHGQFFEKLIVKCLVVLLGFIETTSVDKYAIVICCCCHRRLFGICLGTLVVQELVIAFDNQLGWYFEQFEHALQRLDYFFVDKVDLWNLTIK
jgi:hypothetical protein